ncbi:MAG: hypothetical protein ABI867_44400 [Kofleriaceae bacterium]
MMASGCATSSDALALEASLATCPDDLFTRVTLIRYYHRNQVDGRSRMHPHVLWLLEHHPEIVLHEAWLHPTMDGDAYASLRSSNRGDRCESRQSCRTRQRDLAFLGRYRARRIPAS